MLYAMMNQKDGNWFKCFKGWKSRELVMEWKCCVYCMDVHCSFRIVAGDYGAFVVAKKIQSSVCEHAFLHLLGRYFLYGIRVYFDTNVQ